MKKLTRAVIFVTRKEQNLALADYILKTVFIDIFLCQFRTVEQAVDTTFIYYHFCLYNLLMYARMFPVASLPALLNLYKICAKCYTI